MTDSIPAEGRWARFRTGAALGGRLLEALINEGSAGAVLPPGTRLGAWRLGELLGCGGMSRVYRGERADGRYEQEVAIKVVRGNAPLLERLRHERRLVAGLKHPHLVGLLDGGESEDGRCGLPWSWSMASRSTRICAPARATGPRSCSCTTGSAPRSNTPMAAA